MTAHSETDSENAVLAAINLWPGIEGTVAAKSSSAYETVETQLETAAAALQAEPALTGPLPKRHWRVCRLSWRLLGLSRPTLYLTLLRSCCMRGLEALLVITALLAVLRRSK